MLLYYVSVNIKLFLTATQVLHFNRHWTLYIVYRLETVNWLSMLKRNHKYITTIRNKNVYWSHFAKFCFFFNFRADNRPTICIDSIHQHSSLRPIRLANPTKRKQYISSPVMITSFSQFQLRFSWFRTRFCCLDFFRFVSSL